MLADKGTRNRIWSKLASCWTKCSETTNFKIIFLTGVFHTTIIYNELKSDVKDTVHNFMSKLLFVCSYIDSTSLVQFPIVLHEWLVRAYTQHEFWHSESFVNPSICTFLSLYGDAKTSRAPVVSMLVQPYALPDSKLEAPSCDWYD